MVFYKLSIASFPFFQYCEFAPPRFVLRVHFLVGGLMSMYQDWLAGKFDCSLEELTKSISRMMIQGLQSYTFK